MSGEDECTICEGGGGWFVVRSGYGDRYAETCQHCEGTGVEPFDVAALSDAELVAWWGHLVMLAGWSLLGLWAIRKAFGPREVLHDDVRTARCDGRSGPDDRSMR